MINPAIIDTAQLHLGGRARLRFAKQNHSRTFLAEQQVGYPFHITRPFYLEGDPAGMPTLYLQSVSGGIYAGDDISLDMQIDAGAQAQVTTQASTIVHSARLQAARQAVTIQANEGALFEYLADPLVLFPDARLDTSLHIEAQPGAAVIATDAFINHDPDGEERVFAALCNELVIKRTGIRHCVDRFRVTGEMFRQHTPYCAHGTVVVVCDHLQRECLDALNSALATALDVYAGASLLPYDNGAWARILATDSHALRQALTVCWQILRTTLVGTKPQRRRK